LILLYGSEVWGYENLKILEQIHLKFCKRILKVRNTTPNVIVYGELGRFPLEIRVKLRRWICSNIFKFSYPQTSEPYKSIGSIIESNNFNCKSTGMLSFLIVL
jgi:hypothetical protein